MGRCVELANLHTIDKNLRALSYLNVQIAKSYSVFVLGLVLQIYMNSVDIQREWSPSLCTLRLKFVLYRPSTLGRGSQLLIALSIL